MYTSFDAAGAAVGWGIDAAACWDSLSRAQRLAILRQLSGMALLPRADEWTRDVRETSAIARLTRGLRTPGAEEVDVAVVRPTPLGDLHLPHTRDLARP